MIRAAVLASLLLALVQTFVHVLVAQAAEPQGDDSRYTFNRVDDGYLRLDGRTGQVSLCTRRPSGWVCQMVPDERAVLEAELVRLRDENALLKKTLSAHNLPLPEVASPAPPTVRKDEPWLRLPNRSDFQQVTAFIERVWRRLVAMIVSLQDDLLRGT